MDNIDIERTRQIGFDRLPVGQAKQASILLHDLPHLTVVGTIGDQGLLVKYELPYYTLEKIEAALVDQGFHLDNSLFQKLKRSLIHYFETMQCENLTQPHQVSRSRRIYAQVYQHHAHGDHDETPTEWREYR